MFQVPHFLFFFKQMLKGTANRCTGHSSAFASSPNKQVISVEIYPSISQKALNSCYKKHHGSKTAVCLHYIYFLN